MSEVMISDCDPLAWTIIYDLLGEDYTNNKGHSIIQLFNRRLHQPWKAKKDKNVTLYMT